FFFFQAEDSIRDGNVTGVQTCALPILEELRTRRLECVLRDWNAPSVPVHAVYPSTRHLSPKVKTFVEHLQARMTPPPWELGPVRSEERRVGKECRSGETRNR